MTFPGSFSKARSTSSEQSLFQQASSKEKQNNRRVVVVPCPGGRPFRPMDREYDRGTGAGIPKAVVTISDNTGATRTALTNAFGYYRFDEVATGQTYFINAASKRYSFNPQVLTVGEDLTGVDVIAQD